jgi:hypothetical protein
MLPQRRLQGKRRNRLWQILPARGIAPLAPLWEATYDGRGTVLPRCASGPGMQQLIDVNPTSEHALYLCLFITNAGGW